MAVTGEWVVRLEPDAPPRVEGPAPESAERGGVRVSLEGTVFGSDAPAEAVLRSYLDRGRAAFPSLRGRFSLVVWDGGRRELFALRDPTGARPLFHARGAGGTLLISPSMDALARAPGVDRELDPLYLAGQFVMGIPSAPHETAFRGIRRLPAGVLLCARGSTESIHRYWRLPDERVAPGDVQEQFNALVEQAVHRCQGDGRAAVMLSGGIDSALVAAASTRIGAEPPLALAVLNPTPQADEERTQRAVASALGLEILAVAPEDVVPAGQMLTRSLELMPVPSWPAGALQCVGDELMRQARELGCTSVLDGNGGDEWLVPFDALAGERLIRGDVMTVRDMHQAWPYFHPGASGRDLVRHLVWDGSLRRMAEIAARRALPGPLSARLWRRTRERRAGRLPGWLLPGRGRDLAQWSIDRRQRVSIRNMHRDEKRFLLGAPYTSALMESHVSTRARTGIALCSPLWDADLVAFLASLPQRALVGGGQAKALALGYLAPHLPFARRWPPKTFGDSVIAAVLRREGAAALRSLRGMPALSDLGVVDHHLLQQRVGSPAVRGELDHWSAMAVEAWLRRRL